METFLSLVFLAVYAFAFWKNGQKNRELGQQEGIAHMMNAFIEPTYKIEDGIFEDEILDEETLEFITGTKRVWYNLGTAHMSALARESYLEGNGAAPRISNNPERDYEEILAVISKHMIEVLGESLQEATDRMKAENGEFEEIETPTIESSVKKDF